MAVDDLPRVVIPDDADLFGPARADDPHAVLVDVERHLLAVRAGQDAHGAPPVGFRGQGVEAFLHGAEVASAVAVDRIDGLPGKGPECEKRAENPPNKIFHNI